MATPQGLTRKEGKALTRSRLLDAALAILDEEGEAALTTTEVTRRAGIAQSSFYVHFTDMDDLLHSLITRFAADADRDTRLARRNLRSSPFDAERFRDTFRVPIAHWLAHPQVFRLLLRSRQDRTTPLGEWSRESHVQHRDALLEDLFTGGMPKRTESERRKVEMVADGLIALTDALTLGYLEGRYSDVEEIIDVLVAFSFGYFTLIPEWRAYWKPRHS